MAYKLIDYAKETSLDGIRIRAFDLSKRLFVGYGDSSWANAEGLRTQIGNIVVVTTTSAFNGSSPASVMDWRSSRTKRVIRSTLAGEASAADVAADTAYFTAALFDEALSGKRTTKNAPFSPHIICTDCRSLYDAITKVMLSVHEKRTLIDLLSVRETTGASGVYWVPTNEQHADGLTKLDRKLTEALRAYMMMSYVSLREIDKPVEVISDGEETP